MSLLLLNRVLGFGQSARKSDQPTRIYVNAQHGGCWYRLRKGDGDNLIPENIPHKALIGYIRSLVYGKCERRGKDAWKARLTVEADSLYELECGTQTATCKSLISTLVGMSPEDFHQPLSLEVRNGAREDNCVFLSIIDPSTGQPFTSTVEDWGAADWKAIAQQAKELVNRAQQVEEN